MAKPIDSFPPNKKELEYEARAAKMTADPKTIQKKIERPRFGFILNKGWVSRPDDLPCTICAQPAATIDPQGRRRHPGCRIGA